MSGSKVSIVVPPDEPTVIVRRFLAAPPQRVFDAWTVPDQMRHWYGPAVLELAVCEVDLRVGGACAFVHVAPDGREFRFRGEYLEVQRPYRLAYTSVFELIPDHVTTETLDLDPVVGGTEVTSVTRHLSIPIRDQHVGDGNMERGMADMFDRLDLLLADPGPWGDASSGTTS